MPAPDLCTEDEIVRLVHTFYAKVREDARLDTMSEGWAALGVAAAMYDQGMWSMLTDAIRDIVEADDATELMALAFSDLF